MSLSANIKRLRLERNLTQEQLAAQLGVSAQAVSKWETSETYPDGSLLVPLARALETSLDTLFDNDAVSMADLSDRIISLILHTEEKARFDVIRDICWQIERGLFRCGMAIDTTYDPNEIRETENASYILNDNGFTHISNGKEPFFSVFPQPDDGFGDFLNDSERLREIFSALSREDTVKALIYLYRRPENYVFEHAVLERDCGIASDQIEDVMDDLLTLRVIAMQKLTVNGTERMLFYSHPSHELLAVCLMARQIGYTGAYSLQMHKRSTPFLKT